MAWKTDQKIKGYLLGGSTQNAQLSGDWRDWLGLGCNGERRGNRKRGDKEIGMRKEASKLNRFHWRETLRFSLLINLRQHNHHLSRN